MYLSWSTPPTSIKRTLFYTKVLQSEREPNMSDTFVAYENGLQLLLERIDKTHPECPRIISLQTDLQETIAQVRLSNDTPELCGARKRIVTELNTVVRSLLDISFIDLCILTYIATVQTIGQD